MTSNGAEFRFWIYLDTTNQTHRSTSRAGTRRASSSSALDTTGQLQRLHRSAPPTGYTRQRLHAGGHLRGRLDRVPHRLRLHEPDLHALQARQRHRCLDAAQGRRRHRLRHPVAERHRSRTTHGTLFRGYQQRAACGSTTCAYSDDGIVDARADTTAPTAPATLSAVDHPADSGGAIDLTWAAATDDVGVTGYKLYRGTTAGVYGAPTALGNVTTYTDATAVDRHPLLLRGLRRRRRRQRERQVA